MESDITNAVKLFNASIDLMRKIEQESCSLKNLLSQLTSGSIVNKCIILDKLNTSDMEILMLIEQIDAVLDKLDMEDIVEQLGLQRREFIHYQKEYQVFYKSFHPYLFCPALEEPEQRNQ